MGSLPTTLEPPSAEVAANRSYPTSTGVKSPTSLFKTIPPERIGLNGEYDHSGLAKRVMLAFRKSFSSQEIQHLSVAQRGCVVVLRGQVPQKIMTRLIEIAGSTQGATDVETNTLCLKA
jgi:hypothetical protein